MVHRIMYNHKKCGLLIVPLRILNNIKQLKKSRQNIFQHNASKSFLPLIQKTNNEKNGTMDYLTTVMNPAGMNLPELRNLSPITTVRVPEVPA